MPFPVRKWLYGVRRKTSFGLPDVYPLEWVVDRKRGRPDLNKLMAFMVCHNIDRFRQYSGPQNLGRFRLEKSRVRKIEKDDKALLKFGFDRLKFILDDQPTIRV